MTDAQRKLLSAIIDMEITRLLVTSTNFNGFTEPYVTTAQSNWYVGSFSTLVEHFKEILPNGNFEDTKHLSQRNTFVEVYVGTDRLQVKILQHDRSKMMKAMADMCSGPRIKAAILDSMLTERLYHFEYDKGPAGTTLDQWMPETIAKFIQHNIQKFMDTNKKFIATHEKYEKMFSIEFESETTRTTGFTGLVD